MSRIIEIKGVQYTESQLERALAVEKFVLSPRFKDILMGKESFDTNPSVSAGDS